MEMQFGHVGIKTSVHQSALINAPANAVIEHNLLYNDADTLRKITGGLPVLL